MDALSFAEVGEQLVEKGEIDEGSFLHLSTFTKNMFDDLSLLKNTYVAYK